MSAAGATPPPLPCKEIFDENSQPSAEEISDYARQIGIDPHSESYLLPLAKDGLMQALPTPWKAYYDDKLKAHYFYNPETKVTQWDHPLDQVYKSLVVKARQASERGDSILDDTCMSIQDLPTYEEDPKDISVDKLKDNLHSQNGDSSIDNSLEEELSGTRNLPSKTLTSKKTIGTAQKLGVSSLLKKNISPFGSMTRSGDMKTSLTKMTGESNTFPRTAQLSLSRFKQQDIFNDIFKPDSSNTKPYRTAFDTKNVMTTSVPSKILTKQTSDIIDLSFNPNKMDDGLETDPSKQTPTKGLTLTGGGSVFLKSNRINQNLGATIVNQSNSKSTSTADNPKSILRERNFGELSFKSPVFEKNDQKTVDEEDKKSVRFNLEDKNINFQYDYSPSPSSNSSSDAMLEGNQNSIIQSSNKPPEIPHLARSITRRNSDNSIMLGEIPNFVKNGKLKPLNYEENVRLNQQINKDQSVVDGKQNEQTKTDQQALITNSPVRKLIKPSPSDFIKPNLFQKPFEKLSDILKTSPDSESESDQQPINSNSPPPVKRKLSINLMESVDSEASIDSPDKEGVNTNISNGFPEKESNGVLEFKTRKGMIREVQRRHSIGKMLPVGENEVYDSVQAYKNNFLEKRNVDLNELRKRMEFELKQTKFKMEEEFKVKLDSLKETLKSEQARTEADIRKAIMETQQKHEDEVVQAVEKARFEHIAKKENTIENERKRLAEDIKESIKRMNEDHAKEIERLKQEKKAQLVSMTATMEQENSKAIEELRLQYNDNLEAEKIRLIAENKSILDKMKTDHELMCDELRKDYRSEIELVRGQQAAHLSALREKLRREREPPRPPTALSPPSTALSPRDDMSYERLRCDKRLLEDKYRCLKEKYARLKSDVKISIERRNKRREQSLTTGSETERSHSHKTLPSTDKSGDAGDSNSAAKVGKRLVLVNNNALQYGKSYNNNDAAKEPSVENNNSRADNVDVNDRFNDEPSPNQHHPFNNINNLTVSAKNVRHLSPDALKVKCTLREKSPAGRIVKTERQKSFNGDNESSIGINDISLSQSDSHPISNKYSKRVNIVENYKERTREIGGDGRVKSAIRKINKQDNGYADSTVTDYHDSSDTGASERHVNESLVGRHRKKLFTRLKSASTSRLNYSISSKLNERACSPVENLRQQLRKLEDLEEQFPDVSLNADTTAYRLRYPFPDAGSGGGVSGGELGFLRHRALVEREGVRRARAVLRRRTDLLKQRRRSPAAWQEECELTDMEVSLHRTKAILGEKVIRLRHIEKSLRKLQNNPDTKDSATDSNISKQREPENKDTTLSDISSHSSGFSSTEGHSDTNRNAKHNIHNPVDYEHSSEIINSLQTLNTEIRDIWQVLNAQQQMNVAKVIPIGQLLYTDVGWQLPIAASNIPNIQNLPNAVSINVPAINVTPESVSVPKDRLQPYRHVGNLNPKPTQALPASGNVASSLVERTRDLRDWLKQQAAL